MPTERMLRVIWPSDSSKPKNRHRSPATRRIDKLCPRVVLRYRRSRYQDTAHDSNLLPQHGVEAQYTCRDAFIRNSVLEIKRRDRQHAMPCSSIKNGYSLVPCTDPRYFTTRRRRVKIVSDTRWSSRITQSETYSSNPCLVSWPSPRSPVTMVVTPLSLSQLKSR